MGASKTVKIVSKLPKKASLGEIYQSMELRMALAIPAENGTVFERITPFVKCRDFLTDVFTFSQAKLDFGIYGMSFKGSTNSPDYTKVFLVLKFPDEKARENFFKNISALHYLEQSNKIHKTVVTKADDGEKDEELLFFSVGSNFWLGSCLLFSMYTFIIRALCYDVAGKHETFSDWVALFKKLKNTDSKYMNSIKEKDLVRVCKDLSVLKLKDFCGFPVKQDNLGTIHHNSGFISVFGSHTEISMNKVVTNSHWKELKAQGFQLNA